MTNSIGRSPEYQGIIFYFFFDLIHNYFENYEHSNMIINPPPPKKKEGKNFKIIHNYIYMWLET